MTDPHPATAPVPRSARLREDRGTATAETAIIIPLVVALAFVLVVVGIGWSAQLRVENAARTAARELARGEDTGAATSAARAVAGPASTVSVGRDGPWATVTVTRRLSAPGGPLLGRLSITVSGTAQSRLEPQLLGPAAAAPPGQGARGDA